VEWCKIALKYGGISNRSTKSEIKMLNPKLETLNSKQTQMFKTENSESEEQIMGKRSLIKEATELTKIFGSIVEKSK
jgi:hypothetical protein